MAIDKTVFSSDLTNVIEEIAYDFMLDDVTIDCGVGALDKDEELMIEGVYKNADIQVMINVDVWLAACLALPAQRATLPQVGEKPTVDSTRYRIARTSLSTCKKQLTIDCMRV